MASEGLAADKKKRAEAAVASFLRTKAALCCNRWCVARGRPEARPRCTIAGIGGTGSRRSRRSANICAEDFERFVVHVLGHFPRGIILVVDRWSVHRSAARRLRQRFERRLGMEWLPPYAPDLNPAEGVWNQTKYADLANYLPQDVQALRRAIGRSIRHTAGQQALLRSFFKRAKLRL